MQQLRQRIANPALTSNLNNPIDTHGGRLLSAETLVSTTSFQQRPPPPSTSAHTQDSVIPLRTIEDFGAAVARWCDVLENVRPGLLDKIARAMAEVRGIKLPPKLTICDRRT